MKKYTMILSLLSFLPIMLLQGECSSSLLQDLPYDDNEHDETIVRGQKCECFCSLTVSEDASVSGNLIVNDDLNGGNITAPGGTVDGEFIVNGSSVNGLFAISQYFFIPEETRACATTSQTIAPNTAIAFPIGTVSTTGNLWKQTDSTTFRAVKCIGDNILKGNLSFTATIQFEDSSPVPTKIAAVGTFSNPPFDNTVKSITTVKKPENQNQITITGTAGSTLLKLQFINQSGSPICITSANVTFTSTLHCSKNTSSVIQG